MSAAWAAAATCGGRAPVEEEIITKLALVLPHNTLEFGRAGCYICAMLASPLRMLRITGPILG